MQLFDKLKSMLLSREDKRKVEMLASLNAQVYFEGLKYTVEYKTVDCSILSENLKISSELAAQIIMGAEEMGIITSPTKSNPAEVKVSLTYFLKNVFFYKAGINSRLHDFESVEGIRAIPIPNYKSLGGISSPVNNIEYILQRRATRHKKQANMDLAIECLKKSNEIMPHSNFSWTKQDYMRLFAYLNKAGRIEESEQEEKILRTVHPEIFKSVSARIEDGNLARENQLVTNGYDLVEMTEHYPTCEKCAVLQGRVFSISGKDKRFPSLSIACESGTQRVHEGCKHSVAPWIEAMHTAHEISKAIDKSNLPFVDPRSDEEKALLESQIQAELQRGIDIQNYETIKKLLPDLAPKSFSGYRRMKSMKSANYLKLIKAAEDSGLEIK